MAVALERVQAHGDLFAPVLEDPRPLALRPAGSGLSRAEPVPSGTWTQAATRSSPRSSRSSTRAAAPVTELDMVRDIEVEDGVVSLTIVLTIAGCPLRDSFEKQVDQALTDVPGVRGFSLSSR